MKEGGIVRRRELVTKKYKEQIDGEQGKRRDNRMGRTHEELKDSRNRFLANQLFNQLIVAGLGSWQSYFSVSRI